MLLDDLPGFPGARQVRRVKEPLTTLKKVAADLGSRPRVFTDAGQVREFSVLRSMGDVVVAAHPAILDPAAAQTR